MIFFDIFSAEKVIQDIGLDPSCEL